MCKTFCSAINDTHNDEIVLEPLAGAHISRHCTAWTLPLGNIGRTKQLQPADRVEPIWIPSTMPELLAIPSAGALLAFTAAALVLTITPGPDMSLFLSRAISDGRAAGFACMFGAFSGIVVHTMAAAFGLSALLAASTQLFFLVKLAGAGYLIWLAVQAVRHGSALSLDAGTSKERSMLRHWLTGVGINLLNPKIVLFFVTFLPQFISAGDSQAAGKLIFLGLYFMILAIPITTMLILAAGRFAAALKTNPRIMKLIDWVFAGIFSAFAVKIILTRAS